MRVFFLLFALLAGANASTFHVSAYGNDKNPGTSAARWRTIQREMDDPAGGAEISDR